MRIQNSHHFALVVIIAVFGAREAYKVAVPVAKPLFDEAVDACRTRVGIVKGTLAACANVFSDGATWTQRAFATITRVDALDADVTLAYCTRVQAALARGPRVAA